MLTIGTHMSIAGGIAKTAENVVKMEANTMQIFSRNPRGSNYKTYTSEEIEKFQSIRTEHHFGPILAHAPYTLNPCSKDENTRQFALETMADDMVRMEYLPNNMYNFHPGSHVGQGAEKGIEFILNFISNFRLSA